jgi:hypothetical protein
MCKFAEQEKPVERSRWHTSLEGSIYCDPGRKSSPIQLICWVNLLF